MELTGCLPQGLRKRSQGLRGLFAAVHGPNACASWRQSRKLLRDLQAPCSSRRWGVRMRAQGSALLPARFQSWAGVSDSCRTPRLGVGLALQALAFCRSALASSSPPSDSQPGLGAAPGLGTRSPNLPARGCRAGGACGHGPRPARAPGILQTWLNQSLVLLKAPD